MTKREEALQLASDRQAYVITAKPVDDAVGLLRTFAALEHEGLLIKIQSEDDRGYVTQYVLTPAGTDALNP